VDVTSLLITAGGTLGTVIMSNHIERFKDMGKVIKRAFFSLKPGSGPVWCRPW
jgi:chemotaxis protein MotA